MNKGKRTISEYNNKIVKRLLKQSEGFSKEKKIRILEGKIKFFSNKEMFEVAAALKRERDKLKMKKKDIIISFLKKMINKLTSWFIKK